MHLYLILTLCALSIFSEARLLSFLPRLSSPGTHSLQEPMGSTPGIQLPPVSSDEHGSVPPGSRVTLSDVIGNQRIINIFAGFTRDVATIAHRLDDSKSNSTVLAPINSAITSLPRKPWEDPEDYERLGTKAYSGQDGQDRASGNLQRFTESHIVGSSPWKEGEKVKTLGGNEIWWEKKDGKAFVQPDSIEIESVVKKVANGEVWAIKGVLNYAR